MDSMSKHGMTANSPSTKKKANEDQFLTRFLIYVK